MKDALLALAIFVTALVFATVTQAETATQPRLAVPAQNCAARAAVIHRLETRYGESRRSVGMAANQALVEVFANDGTGSWSILVTTATGRTCLVASGMSFETLAAVPVDRGEPA
ncbi:MAG: hypothetical protein ACU0CO_13465 [Shimia sp.]